MGGTLNIKAKPYNTLSFRGDITRLSLAVEKGARLWLVYHNSMVSPGLPNSTPSSL